MLWYKKYLMRTTYIFPSLSFLDQHLEGGQFRGARGGHRHWLWGTSELNILTEIKIRCHWLARLTPHRWRCQSICQLGSLGRQLTRMKKGTAWLLQGRFRKISNPILQSSFSPSFSHHITSGSDIQSFTGWG